MRRRRRRMSRNRSRGRRRVLRSRGRRRRRRSRRMGRTRRRRTWAYLPSGSEAPRVFRIVRYL